MSGSWMQPRRCSAVDGSTLAAAISSEFQLSSCAGMYPRSYLVPSRRSATRCPSQLRSGPPLSISARRAGSSAARRASSACATGGRSAAITSTGSDWNSAYSLSVRCSLLCACRCSRSAARSCRAESEPPPSANNASRSHSSAVRSADRSPELASIRTAPSRETTPCESSSSCAAARCGLIAPSRRRATASSPSQSRSATSSAPQRTTGGGGLAVSSICALRHSSMARRARSMVTAMVPTRAE
mmetsp:Transcript_4597/g.14133  ORF Transcript_4597/g.14133 Transcript_4597/m.14133 type:complete len:243 (-) Transcript_4597:274-1002(-)